MPLDAQKLIKLHERGVLTDTELRVMVAQAAATADPGEIVPLVPAWVVDALRVRAAEPAGEIFGSWCGPAEGYEPYYREQTRLHAEGFRRWAAYFAAGAVIPPGDAARSPEGAADSSPG